MPGKPVTEWEQGDWVRFDGLDWQYVGLTRAGDVLLNDTIGHGPHWAKLIMSEVAEVRRGIGVRWIGRGNAPELFAGAYI